MARQVMREVVGAHAVTRAQALLVDHDEQNALGVGFLRAEGFGHADGLL